MAPNGSKSALIVDTNEVMLQTVSAAIEKAGFHACATSSGREALQLLKSDHFDILLVADHLADMRSTDFLQRVEQMPVQPWTVVMQGSMPTPQQLRDYLLLGACAVVGRNPDEICKAVVSCCVPWSSASNAVN